MRRLGTLIVLVVLLSIAISCDQPGGTIPDAPSGTVVLSYERTGGIAGFQDRLVIGAAGEYYLTKGSRERIGSVGDSRRKTLGTWLSQYASFTLTLEDNPGGPDNMRRQVVWAGVGGALPTPEEQRQMLEWAAGLLEELTAKQ